MSAVVRTLAHCLDLDTGTLIPDLWRVQSDRLAHSAGAQAVPAVEQQRAEEEMEERDGEVKGRKNMRMMDSDVAEFLPVSLEHRGLV